MCKKDEYITSRRIYTWFDNIKSTDTIYHTKKEKPYDNSNEQRKSM